MCYPGFVPFCLLHRFHKNLRKQDYITKRLTDRQIVVQGNPRVYKALRNQMAEIYEELKHLEKCSEENEELLSTLRLVAETLYVWNGR